ncbi:MAG: histidine kinase [Rudanella sp.]|nr:histidine kinase [Rudanella sp.]
MTESQLLLQQEQNRVLASQLHLQEEKERIARDLHDHVGSHLSIIANSLDYMGHEPVTSKISTVSYTLTVG